MYCCHIDTFVIAETVSQRTNVPKSLKGESTLKYVFRNMFYSLHTS